MARLGGDEFAIVVRGTDDVAVLSDVADRALSVLQAPFTMLGQFASVGASVGVAVMSAQDSERWTVETLKRSADQALYGAKRAGKGRSMIAA